MDKKEFTKKQLKKQLTSLTEGKGPQGVNNDIYDSMRDSYKALKRLSKALVGHKSGEDTISNGDIMKITNAKDFIYREWGKLQDFDSKAKKELTTGEEEEVVVQKNEQSEGYGKMYNALKGIKEGKVVKINEKTLKKVVSRVIKEQIDGSEDFGKWCVSKGFKDSCSPDCWLQASMSGDVLMRKAAMAKKYCTTASK